jgi:hypothetical protein
MKLMTWGNEFVFIAMGVFSSFRRHLFKKDIFTWKFQKSLSLDYKRPKREPNSPEAPIWHNVMHWRQVQQSEVPGPEEMHECVTLRHDGEKTLLCKHVFHSSKFGQPCTAICPNTYYISCIFQIYGFPSLKWSGVMLSVLSCLVLL